MKCSQIKLRPAYRLITLWHTHNINWTKTFETGRVAVYLRTHCNIGSKRAFPTGGLNKWHNCFLIYWRSVAWRITRTSVCLPLRHDSAKCRRQRSPKFGFFRGLIAPKPNVPHHNSSTKGTSMGCRLVPEMIPIARNCAVWAVPLSQNPLESTYFWLFWDL